MTTRIDQPKEINTEISGNPLSRVYKIKKQTHTLGNVLKSVLLQNENVNFAAYSVPHPLTEQIEMRIQVNEGDANVAMKDSLNELMKQVEHLDSIFDEAYNSFIEQENAMQD